MKEKIPLSHEVVCFLKLDFETSSSKLEVSKSNLSNITSFSKTTLLQREPFLTMGAFDQLPWVDPDVAYFIFFQDERGHTITPRSSSNLEKNPDTSSREPSRSDVGAPRVAPSDPIHKRGSSGCPEVHRRHHGKAHVMMCLGFFQVRGRTWGNCVPTLVLEKKNKNTPHRGRPREAKRTHPYTPIASTLPRKGLIRI